MASAKKGNKIQSTKLHYVWVSSKSSEDMTAIDGFSAHVKKELVEKFPGVLSQGQKESVDALIIFGKSEPVDVLE